MTSDQHKELIEKWHDTLGKDINFQTHGLGSGKSQEYRDGMILGMKHAMNVYRNCDSIIQYQYDHPNKP